MLAETAKATTVSLFEIHLKRPRGASIQGCLQNHHRDTESALVREAEVEAMDLFLAA